MCIDRSDHCGLRIVARPPACGHQVGSPWTHGLYDPRHGNARSCLWLARTLLRRQEERSGSEGASRKRHVGLLAPSICRVSPRWGPSLPLTLVGSFAGRTQTHDPFAMFYRATGGTLSTCEQGKNIWESPHFVSATVVLGLLTMNAILAFSGFGKSVEAKKQGRTVHAYLGAVSDILSVSQIPWRAHSRKTYGSVSCRGCPLFFGSTPQATMLSLVIHGGIGLAGAL